MSQKSFQFEFAFSSDLVGGCTDERYELARLGFPLTGGLIVEAQCLATDGQCHLAALARL